MLQAVRAIYRESKKPRDNFWTEWCSRPPAAAVVWMLKPTRVTPNQVTFAALAVFAVAAALLVGWTSYAGVVAGAIAIQASYVLDCVDGQLARYKKMASPVGALLDFLMDEIKAFLLVGACAVRQWRTSGDARWLVVGIGGLVTVASGIALTTFMRRDEYLDATGARAAATGGSKSPIGHLIGAIEWVGKNIIQYPQYVWILLLFNRLDVFLAVYLAANFMYLGRSALIVLVKLGRPA